MADPAYAHYRVARTLSDVPPGDRRPRSDPPPRAPRPGGRAPTYRDMATGPGMAVHDVVQIFDREGRTVWSTSFDLRSDGERFEASLVDDLLTLNLEHFRAKYGLSEPAAEPVDPPEPANRTGWEPSSDAGGRREGDIRWDR